MYYYNSVGQRKTLLVDLFAVCINGAYYMILLVNCVCVYVYVCIANIT